MEMIDTQSDWGHAAFPDWAKTGTSLRPRSCFLGSSEYESENRRQVAKMVLERTKERRDKRDPIDHLSVRDEDDEQHQKRRREKPWSGPSVLESKDGHSGSKPGNSSDNPKQERKDTPTNDKKRVPERVIVLPRDGISPHGKVMSLEVHEPRMRINLGEIRYIRFD